MKITIDNQEIKVNKIEDNIVDIAQENGINIVAPCYRNKNKGGCCKACVIEVDGKEQYACGTKPFDGMNITYNREDLEELRRKRRKEYALMLKNKDKEVKKPQDSECCDTGNETSSCCSSGCDC